MVRVFSADSEGESQGFTKMIETSAFLMAQRFVGMKEVEGIKNNPMIMAMLTQDMEWPKDDETPWCSAFVNHICWLLRLPRSKSLLARSWLKIGRTIPLEEAVPGFDVVVMSRGTGPQPDENNTTAPGHVGFYAGHNHRFIQVLGGNQKNAVNVSAYPHLRLLSIRRLL